ncbi:PorP/SprF family type IX secretion system membrane protein [Hugenholtzia roseola]|uniref:PorP/SprF family type IX secretion system membrane protein n=1 Tax=Hugenholtzia roseola TaxID=1002 RepID=UPI000A3290E9|nr:PorP/SprF family type IX secretion system membrane protein [Hugenholtzia roseola]
MMIKKLLSFVVFLLPFLFFFSLPLSAQESQLTQFYALPSHLNPAFTGIVPYYRFGIAHRAQWLEVGRNGYQTTLASAELNLGENKGGLGLLLKQVSHQLGSQLSLSPTYAYHFQVSRKVMIAAALSPSYTFSRGANLLFEDAILSGNPTQDPLQALTQRQHQVRLHAAGALYTEKFWVGTALFSLLELQWNEVEQTQNLGLKNRQTPIRYALHGGAKLEIAYQTHYLPALLYERQRSFHKLDLQNTFQIQQFLGGLGYRGFFLPTLPSHNIALILGWKYEQWQIGFAYEQNIGGVVNRGSTYELTLAFCPPYDFRKKKGYQSIRCPIQF